MTAPRLAPEDIRAIGDHVMAALKGYVEEVAAREARSTAFAALDLQNTDLLRRINDVLKKAVQDEVSRHVRVRLEWRP